VSRKGARVLRSFIDAMDTEQIAAQVARWARARQSRTVYFCNAHSVVTANDDPRFAGVLDRADVAAPDGAPVAWMLRRLGHAGQPRVSGPDFMARLCAELADSDVPVFLFGSTPETLEQLEHRLKAQFPGLRIAGAVSPPFGTVSPQADALHVDHINRSGAGVVFVGLGCPKQETWCDQHRGQVHAVMLAVGAAFDFHAGTLKRAPHWMRALGLEWMHRLLSEPRRLWKRYLVTNSAFAMRAAAQLLNGDRTKGR